MGKIHIHCVICQRITHRMSQIEGAGACAALAELMAGDQTAFPVQAYFQDAFIALTPEILFEKIACRLAVTDHLTGLIQLRRAAPIDTPARQISNAVLSPTPSTCISSDSGAEKTASRLPKRSISAWAIPLVSMREMHNTAIAPVPHGDWDTHPAHVLKIAVSFAVDATMWILFLFHRSYAVLIFRRIRKDMLPYEPSSRHQ